MPSKSTTIYCGECKYFIVTRVVYKIKIEHNLIRCAASTTATAADY